MTRDRVIHAAWTKRWQIMITLVWKKEAIEIWIGQESVTDPVSDQAKAVLDTTKIARKERKAKTRDATTATAETGAEEIATAITIEVMDQRETCPTGVTEAAKWLVGTTLLSTLTDQGMAHVKVEYRLGVDLRKTTTVVMDDKVLRWTMVLVNHAVMIGDQGMAEGEDPLANGILRTGVTVETGVGEELNMLRKRSFS